MAITEGSVDELTSNNGKNDTKSGRNVYKNGYKNGENRKKQNVQERLLINENRENGETKEPWKISAQNMQRFVTTNSKEKVEIKKEYFGENNILIANLTETWLDSTIKDVVEIEGYNIFRGDRKKREGESKDREGGGTAIYLCDKIEANQICEMSNGVCDMVAVIIPET